MARGARSRRAPPAASAERAACPGRRAPPPSSARRAGCRPRRLSGSAAATPPAPRPRPRSRSRASGTQRRAGGLGAVRTRPRSHPSFGIRHSGDVRDAIDVTEVLMHAIQVNELRKTYAGGVEAVKGIDFEVAAGEVFGLLGPNGAGKSTTIGMLTTTIAPSRGSASVAGFNVASEPLAARRVSSVVFQDPVVDRALTGRRNLDIHARLWRVDPGAARNRISELAQTLGLAELLDRRVASYSGGERRRLEIARALVSQPEVLFLDEPTVGLDPRIRHELLEAIGRLRERNQVTILLTTHYLDEAERLCDRIAIIHAGRIVALDTPRALLSMLGHEIVEVRVNGN